MFRAHCLYATLLLSLVQARGVPWPVVLGTGKTVWGFDTFSLVVFSDTTVLTVTMISVLVVRTYLRMNLIVTWVIFREIKFALTVIKQEIVKCQK